MIIEITGVGFHNKGAELMLLAVKEQVASWGDIGIALAPHSSSPYLNRARLGAWQKVNLRLGKLNLNSLSYFLPKSFRNSLRRSFGLVFEADIDAVLDAAGFAYGDPWGERSIKKINRELKRWHRHGKKYIFLPQAFGPFEKLSKSQPQNSFHLSPLIFARDQDSLEYLRSYTKMDSIQTSPDFTPLVMPEKTVRSPDGNVIIIPNFNMLSRRNSEASGNYLDFLDHAILASQALGYRPVLLNHEGDKDLQLCRQLAEKHKLDVICDLNAIEVKIRIGGASAVISSRYHACMSALSQAVPCLGTSWSHKYKHLFRDFGRERYLLTPDLSMEAVKETLAEVIRSAKDQDYLEAIDKVKEKNRQMWASVRAEVMGNRS